MKRPLMPVVVVAALPILAATAAIRLPALQISEVGRSYESVRPGSATEPPVTVLSPGDRAPNFAYETVDGATLRLHDVLRHGHVLLVFEPTRDQLVALERDRQALLKRGVLVAAVLDRSGRGTRTLAERLGLHYTLIPDPRAVIGTQFNVLRAHTRRAGPAWFVLDSTGKVRALDRQRVPNDSFVVIASQALALPAPDAPLPSSQPR